MCHLCTANPLHCVLNSLLIKGRVYLFQPKTIAVFSLLMVIFLLNVFVKQENFKEVFIHIVFLLVTNISKHPSEHFSHLQ